MMLAMDGEQPGDAQQNLAFRINQRSASAVFSADWSTVRSLWAPDAFRDDRRSMGAHDIRGIDALISSAKEWVNLGFVLSEIEFVAKRGDRLSVARTKIRTPDDYLIEFLALTELDGRGLIDRMVYFDVDDVPAAHAELDLRLSELESSS
jgi:hypothetical protein